MSLIKLFFRQIRRESLLLFRQIRLILNSSLVFLMIMVFFPLTMPPNVDLLHQLSAGLVWVALLMALLISSDRMFQQDYDDGVIEQWLVSGQPLSLLVTAKVLVHWFFNVLPLVVFSPLLALLFGLSGYETLALVLSLVIGSPAILFLCALTAVFSGGLRQKGVFMALILLPLAIPVMIFGSGAVTIAMQGASIAAYLALLAAMSLVSISLLPFAIAGMIRISLVD